MLYDFKIGDKVLTIDHVFGASNNVVYGIVVKVSDKYCWVNWYMYGKLPSTNYIDEGWFKFYNNDKMKKSHLRVVSKAEEVIFY